LHASREDEAIAPRFVKAPLHGRKIKLSLESVKRRNERQKWKSASEGRARIADEEPSRERHSRTLIGRRSGPFYHTIVADGRSGLEKIQFRRERLRHRGDGNPIGIYKNTVKLAMVPAPLEISIK